MTEHLILVDASGFAFRAFYSAHPRYRAQDGEPTGAIEVFCSMVWRMLGRARDDQPTMGVAVFDAPGANFRHALFPAYKANRDPARRVELDKQFPIMRAAAALLGLTPVELAGFEADDLIATLVQKARKKGIRVTIVSSDKDFAQLVEDDHIEIVDPMARKRVLAADVEKKFGVEPALVADVQALAGDSIDGIPGMPGCGLDIAARLVRRFGSLEGVLANIGGVRFPKVRVALERSWDVHVPADGAPKLVAPAKGSDTAKTGADWCRTFLHLTTLRRTVKMKPDWEAYRVKPVMREDLLTFLNKLGAGARAESIFGLDPQMVRVVTGLAKGADPLDWWREELKYGPDKKPLPDVPQCGFYQRSTVHRGAPVPARIWRDTEFDWTTDQPTGNDLLRCELGGRPRDPLGEWPSLSMKPISEAQFREMMRKYAAGAPAPRVAPVDLSTVQSIPNPRLKRKS